MNFSNLYNETLKTISVSPDKTEIRFITWFGEEFRLYHEQDCCESVAIDDICGDLNDLLDSPITLAEESTNRDEIDGRACSESWTWTFYKLATVKGYVDIRWLGESNGYYSESVYFECTNKVDREMWIYNNAIKEYVEEE